jgi:uncharacterized protein
MRAYQNRLKPEFSMKRILTTTAALIGLALTAPGQIAAKGTNAAGPSFNCARARTNAEIAICASPTFSAQDRAIASLYPRVLAATRPARKAALAQDQALFNRSRETCFAGDEDQDVCLGNLLSSRIGQLNGWLRRGYP